MKRTLPTMVAALAGVAHAQQPAPQTIATDPVLRAVVAAERSADATVVYAWLTGVSVLLLGATAIFACLAWMAARRSANIADETRVVQLRAYVSMKDYTLTVDEATKKATIAWHTPNNGVTPAREFKVSWDAKVCAESEISGLQPTRKDPTIYYVRASGQLEHDEIIDLNDVELAALKADNQVLGAVVRLDYVDAFKNPRKLECRMKGKHIKDGVYDLSAHGKDDDDDAA